MKIKNKKPLIYLILLCLFLAIGGTVAYYYSQVVVPNRFQAMTYSIKIREEFNNEFGTKRVYIDNFEETNTPVVLRVSYNEYWTNDAGTILNSLDLAGNSYVTKNWTNAFLNDFTLGSDGWYYYKKVLKPETSVQLLESVAQDNSPGADTKYHLDFNYEAIQATEEAVLDIWGRNITISGDDVVWGS